MTPAQSRRTLGMTVNQFAAALGVNAVTVRRWEMSQEKASHRVPSRSMTTAIRTLVEHSNTAQNERTRK